MHYCKMWCSSFMNFPRHFNLSVQVIYAVSINFRKRCEQLFSEYEGNFVIDACGETKSGFSPFLFECSYALLRAPTYTRVLSRTHARTLVFVSVFADFAGGECPKRLPSTVKG